MGAIEEPHLEQREATGSSDLWRSAKYEEVCLRADESMSQAREGIGGCRNCYNAMTPAPGGR